MEINQYPLESFSFQDEDYYDIDFWTGSGYQTKKILGSVIKAGILAAVENIYNADGTLTGNRAVNIDGKILSFISNNAGEFEVILDNGGYYFSKFSQTLAQIFLQIQSVIPSNQMTFDLNPVNTQLTINDGVNYASLQINGVGSALNFTDGITNYRVEANEQGVEINSSYILPNTDGTAGQVLTTDGAGVTSWQDSATTIVSWGDIVGTLADQTDLQAALDAKEDVITAGTTSEYWRGDKTFQTLDKTAVGLGNVDNTSDLNKPISTATQTALDAKLDDPLGLASQYIRGDGTLGIFPSVGGGGGGSVYYFNGNTSQGSIGGTTMFQLSKVAQTGAAANFTRNTIGTIASFITDVNDPNQLSVPSGIWVFECYLSETGGGSNHATIQCIVEKWNGTSISVIGTGVVEEITNGSVKDLYTLGVTIPSGITLSATDRIVVQVQVANPQGKTITLYTENSSLSSVTTTFSNGISSLNGLTPATQLLTTGTSGTDFNISSSGDTHTFNVPTASAANTGKLSNTDWSTFNGKQNALISGTNIKTIEGQSLLGSGNIDLTKADVGLGNVDNTSDLNKPISTATQTALNSKQNSITLTTTGTSGISTLIGNTLNIPNYATGSVNIYNADGTLTGARIVNLNAQGITFQDGSLTGSQFAVNIDNGTNLSTFTLQPNIFDLETITAGLGSVITGTLTSLLLKYVGAGGIKQLQINNGGLRINGQYYLPNTDGTSGQVVTTDGSGNLSFTTISSSTPFIPAVESTEIRRGFIAVSASASTGTYGALTPTLTGSATAVAFGGTTKLPKLRLLTTIGSTNSVVGIAFAGSAVVNTLSFGFRFIGSYIFTDQSAGGTEWFVPTARQFCGLAPNSTILGITSAVSVDSFPNIIGMGSDASDTNLQIYHNDATGFATKIDLGVNFPANKTGAVANGIGYQLELYAPYGATSVKYRVTKLSDNTIVTGTISTNLPASTTALGPQVVRTSGATSQNVSIDVIQLTASTLY